MDPAVEAERLVFRRAYAEAFAGSSPGGSPARDATADLITFAQRSIGAVA